MGLERHVVDAVVLEGRSPTEIARRHGISRSWLYQLLARYREGGYPGLAPRSRQPHTSPNRTSPDVEAAILALRGELGRAESHPESHAQPGRRFGSGRSPMLS